MSSLRDGLGGEEIQISGIELSGTNAIYVSPYFLGSVTSESQFSGADIYSNDKVHGKNIYGDTVVSGLLIKGDTVNTLEGELESAAVGSAFGAIVQAGSVNFGTNAGSGTIAFKRAYTGFPSVVVSIGSAAAGVVSVAAAGAGSTVLYTNRISTTGCEIICGLGSGAAGFEDGPVINWIAVGV